MGRPHRIIGGRTSMMQKETERQLEFKWNELNPYMRRVPHDPERPNESVIAELVNMLIIRDTNLYDKAWAELKSRSCHICGKDSADYEMTYGCERYDFCDIHFETFRKAYEAAVEMAKEQGGEDVDIAIVNRSFISAMNAACCVKGTTWMYPAWRV